MIIVQTNKEEDHHDISRTVHQCEPFIQLDSNVVTLCGTRNFEGYL